MEKVTSKKLLPWTKNDYILNIFVYAINVIIFMLFYVATMSITNREVSEVFSDAAQFINFVVLIVFIFAVMAVYFAFEDRNFLKSAANSEMIFLIMELSYIVCFASGFYVNYYLRPLALVALLTLFLTNTRTAVFVDVLFCMVLFLFDAFSGTKGMFENNIISAAYFLVTGLTSSAVAIYFTKNVYSRIKLLALSFLISVPTVICVAIPTVSLGSNDWRALLCAVASGPLSASVCMILLPVLESFFKKVTCFKYAELTDHKAKLIKRLIEQAPGTFNHSMVVSNIAEACATAIGVDPLLARTCAYYHDVGKLRRPEMFKENQTDGVNPHNDLTPELSANIIRSHTQDGYALVMKNRLPKAVADVCLEHHGTMPILYFYDKAKKFTDGEVDILQFCYQGPKPKTTIAAIIMIADASEAATRALKDRSRENVLEVVRKIVNERMKLGQFEDCEITLKEINVIINTVVNSLTGVYHSRIEYPKVSLDEIDITSSGEEE